MASNEPTDGEVIEQIQNTAGAGARFSPGPESADKLPSSHFVWSRVTSKIMLRPCKLSSPLPRACIDCMQSLMLFSKGRTLRSIAPLRFCHEAASH